MTRHTRQARINGSPEPNSPKGRSFRWVAELEENGSPHNSAIFEGSYSDGLTVEKSCESRKEASPMELNEPFSKTSAESQSAERWDLILRRWFAVKNAKSAAVRALSLLKNPRVKQSADIWPAMAAGLAAWSVYIDYSIRNGWLRCALWWNGKENTAERIDSNVR